MFIGGTHSAHPGCQATMPRLAHRIALPTGTTRRCGATIVTTQNGRRVPYGTAELFRCERLLFHK